MASDRTQTHQSLHRGLRIIEAAAAGGGTATLAELARRTALPRSTAHHIIRALVALGYLAQDGDGRPYRLGPKLLRITGRTWTGEQMAELARKHLEELGRRTGESISLAVLRAGAPTIVAKRESEGPVRVVQEIGAQRPLHCTAVGKVLVAWLPERELDAILAQTSFTQLTPRTLASADAFRRELVRVRSRGVAYDNEEHLPGIRCIAAPVRDLTGEVCASLCVVGQAHRLPQRRLNEIEPELLAVAAALSRELGHEAD